VAPIDVRRVHPTENTNEIATEQVKRLLRELPERAGAHDEAPLFVFDAGYDPVRSQQGLEECRMRLLVRLRAGRCCYPTRHHPLGRDGPRHREKLDTKDPRTWPMSTAEHRCEDLAHGEVRVRS
jgi:hypothetical protein